MQMLKKRWQSAAGLALVGALVAPAATAEIYGWRTDDGNYAYTDNRANIPSRYADDAVAMRDTGLDGYARLTVQDTAAQEAVAARLERRLEHLRRVNASIAPELSGDAIAAGGSGATRIQIATGNDDAPTLDIATDAGGAPIVVEPVIARKAGDVRTRRVTLVKQGDRTLAVVLGRSHQVNPNDDILDEDELLEAHP